MKTFLDKRQILNRFKIAKNFKSDTELANFLGINKSTLSNWYKRDSADIELLFSFCEQISIDWLISGEGEMLKSDNHVPDDGKMVSIDRINEDISSIPIADISVAAGVGGCYNQDLINSEESIALPNNLIRRNSTYIAIRVKGDSMSPTILDSSYLIIRLLNTAEWAEMPDDQVYVITDTEGKAYVKRLRNRLSRGFVVCTSDNPDKYNYPNFNLQQDEINTIWHVEWLLSAKMPNIHQVYYAQVSELRDDVDVLKSEFSKIIKKINNI